MAFHGELGKKIKKFGKDARQAVIDFAKKKSGIVPGTASQGGKGDVRAGTGGGQIALSDADANAAKAQAAIKANEKNESGDAGDPQKKEFNKEQERKRRQEQQRQRSIAGGGQPVNKRGK